jgi:glycosyltransferase involved in cell wall biosynthesis
MFRFAERGRPRPLRPRDVDHAPHSPVFLLAALDWLVERRPELRDRIRLHLVGPLTIREKDALDQARCRDLVEAHGYLPHEESLAFVRSADALFLPLHRLPRGGRATILPAKLYEYLASGRPILAAVPDGDARDLLGSVDWTVRCAPDDVEGMAQGCSRSSSRCRRAAASRPTGRCCSRGWSGRISPPSWRGRSSACWPELDD